MRKKIQLTIERDYWDTKSPGVLAHVVYDGKIHFAVQCGEYVIAYEHIPENYPAQSMAVHTLANWQKEIEKCWWIKEGMKEEE